MYMVVNWRHCYVKVTFQELLGAFFLNKKNPAVFNGEQETESSCEDGSKNPSLVITVFQHLAADWWQTVITRDGFVDPTLTLMIDSNIFLAAHSFNWCVMSWINYWISSPEDYFANANCADLDEISTSVMVFHLGLHYLPKYPLEKYQPTSS